MSYFDLHEFFIQQFVVQSLSFNHQRFVIGYVVPQFFQTKPSDFECRVKCVFWWRLGRLEKSVGETVAFLLRVDLVWVYIGEIGSFDIRRYVFFQEQLANDGQGSQEKHDSDQDAGDGIDRPAGWTITGVPGPGVGARFAAEGLFHDDVSRVEICITLRRPRCRVAHTPAPNDQPWKGTAPCRLPEPDRDGGG